MTAALTSTQAKADRVCLLMLIGGVFLFALESFKTQLLPMHFAHPEVLNTVCTIGSSALFSAIIFNAIRDSFTDRIRLRRHFLAALAGGLLLLLLFMVSYWEYLYIARVLIKFESVPNRFPEMVEDMQRDKGEKEELWARLIYDTYGVRLAYHRSVNNWTYYIPSSDDLVLRQRTEEMNAKLLNLQRISLGLLFKLSDIAITVFFTFFICFCGSFFMRLEFKSQ